MCAKAFNLVFLKAETLHSLLKSQSSAHLWSTQKVCFTTGSISCLNRLCLIK